MSNNLLYNDFIVNIYIQFRRVAPYYTPTRSCVHISVLKKSKEQKKYGRQTTRANHPANTPKQYWKVSLYYAFIYHIRGFKVGRYPVLLPA